MSFFQLAIGISGLVFLYVGMGLIIKGVLVNKKSETRGGNFIVDILSAIADSIKKISDIFPSQEAKAGVVLLIIGIVLICIGLFSPEQLIAVSPVVNKT